MRFRNVSGVDLEVPAAGVVVAAGDVVDVDGQLAEGMAGQDGVWAAVTTRPSTTRRTTASRARSSKPKSAEVPAASV